MTFCLCLVAVIEATVSYFTPSRRRCATSGPNVVSVAMNSCFVAAFWCALCAHSYRSVRSRTMMPCAVTTTVAVLTTFLLLASCTNACRDRTELTPLKNPHHPSNAASSPNRVHIHEATVRRMKLRAGHLIDRIQYWNAAGHSHSEGGVGGDIHEIELCEEECFVRLERWQHGWVHGIRLVTNKGRGFGRFGSDDDNKAKYDAFVAPTGMCLIGIGMRGKCVPKEGGTYIEHVDPFWG